MREPLLDQNDDYLVAFRRACDTARKEATDCADAETIVAGLARWCREALLATRVVKTEGRGLSDLLVLPPARSPLRVFQGIVDTSRRRSLEEGFTALMEGSENEHRAVMAWLFGRALAQGFVDELTAENAPTQPLLARLWSLVQPPGVEYGAFEESLQEQLRHSPAARSAMRSELETWISDIQSDPGSGTSSSERKEFNAFVDSWRSSPSLDKLWKAQEGLFPVHYDLLKILPGILPTDRAAILTCLDHFDFPHPIRQVLQHNAILHDRDEITEALKLAPTCSEDGRSWNGRQVALLVLQTAEEHCQALWQAVHRGDSVDNDDPEVMGTTQTILSSWFEELGRTVMARPDRQFLGPQWLLLKVADERLDRARRTRTGDQSAKYLRQDDLIEWIALGLSKAGLTAGTIAPLVDFPDLPASYALAPAQSASQDDEKTSPRLGALSMMSLIDHMIGAASAENGQQLLNKLDALLASRDSAFETEALLTPGTHDLPASCCGYLLAQVEEPAQQWRQSWNFLTEQRRRAQHWRQTDDSDALAPSLFLLATGTSSIDWLLSSPQSRPDKARDLWRELFDGARDCWLTISLHHLVERIETHIGRLFARHPAVFGNAVEQGDDSGPSVVCDASGYTELLTRDLDCLGGDDFMLAVCCLNAHYNGVTPAIMDKVLQRNAGHLNAILRQFEQWQQLERPVRRRTEIVEELAALRAEMKGAGTL